MTMVICHRGDSGRCPENTKLAFCQALQSGAEGIELDVHLTRDGHVVVIHDERVDRTTNGNGYVKDMTLAQLRRLQITGKGEAQSILTLEEYFAIAAPAGIRTNIELKTGWKKRFGPLYRPTGRRITFYFPAFTSRVCCG